MAEFKQIRIKKHSEHCGLDVIVDENAVATNLASDEALACIASALFGSHIPYVKPYETWLRREQEFRNKTNVVDPRKD